MSSAAAWARTGPASRDPATGKPYALDFPVITIRDMVRAQAMLIDHLGIDSLFCVAGGSMGGMQVLQWAASYPERVFSAMPIATAARHSAQNIAFHEVGRQAIMADPDWRGGHYLQEGTRPEKGLAVARMAAHITYLSEPALHRKFGRKFQDREAPTFSFDADFQIESYLRYQGRSFVERFDANSYLYLTRAMDYFDLAADYDGVARARVFAHQDAVLRGLVHSDWLFPTADSRAIVHALNASGASVSSSRSRPTRGTTPSCSISLKCSPRRAASSTRPRGRAGCDSPASTCMADAIDAPHGRDRDAHRPRARRRHGGARSRVLDVGCGDGELLRYAAGRAQRRRARHRDLAARRQRMRGARAFR